MSRNPTWTRDELILALDLYIREGRRSLGDRHPQVAALSDLLNRLPIHPADLRAAKFRNPAGVALKVENLRAYDPERITGGKGMPRGGQGDREVWADYGHRLDDLAEAAAAIRASLAGSSGSLEELGEDEGFSEGRLLERMHKRRERNRTLVASKLKQVQEHTGALACEACGFDFLQVYGELGKGFAECHHVRPLSEVGPTETKLSDLAVVCANCHRMIHRSRPMLTVEGLRALVGTWTP